MLFHQGKPSIPSYGEGVAVESIVGIGVAVGVGVAQPARMEMNNSIEKILYIDFINVWSTFRTYTLTVSQRGKGTQGLMLAADLAFVMFPPTGSPLGTDAGIV